jgi:hypothetical protein
VLRPRHSFRTLLLALTLSSKGARRLERRQVLLAGLQHASERAVGEPMRVLARELALCSMRRDLASQNKCDATCPVSNAIFVRMAAKAAWEGISANVPTSQVSPLWRAIEPDSRITKKSCRRIPRGLHTSGRWMQHPLQPFIRDAQ